MRVIPIFLALLLILIQGPLWFGRGGVLDAGETARKVEQNQSKNNLMIARNEKLRAEVDDLRSGTSAIEERARKELGMIKSGEIFIQITDSGMFHNRAQSDPNLRHKEAEL